MSEDNAKFFDISYYAKRALWPKMCVANGCNKRFTNKPKKQVEAGEYKVGKATPIWWCRCAGNVNHGCVHAFCAPCKSALQKEEEEEEKAKREQKRKETGDRSPEKLRESKRARKGVNQRQLNLDQ